MIVMKQQDHLLNKRQTSLCILIAIAITFPAIGASIRHYIDDRMFPELGITMTLVLILFIIIRKCIMVVTKNTRQVNKYQVVYP
jgi:hypothetical protein